MWKFQINEAILFTHARISTGKFSNFLTARLTVTLLQPDNFWKIHCALRLLVLRRIQGQILLREIQSSVWTRLRKISAFLAEQAHQAYTETGTLLAKHGSVSSNREIFTLDLH